MSSLEKTVCVVSGCKELESLPHSERQLPLHLQHSFFVGKTAVQAILSREAYAVLLLFCTVIELIVVCR